jgi:tetratricopeptide (TPR) repeat protein/TolB-like protein
MVKGSWQIAAVLLVAMSGPAAAQPSTPTVVVPFENLQDDPRVQWLGEASAVLLTDGLASRRVQTVDREDRVRAFEQLRLPAPAALSHATVIKVAQLVGASEVVVGSFRVDGSELIVEARGIRVDVGRLKPSVHERGPLTDLFAIFDRLSARLTLDAQPSGTAPRQPPLGAFENYIKGLVAESPDVQATFLESALREHPGFDRASIALWRVRTEQRDYGAAFTAARGVQAESPLASQARFYAAVSLLQLQRFDEAYAAFRGLAPADTSPRTAAAEAAGAAFNNLGVIQIRRGGTQQTGTATYFLTKAAEADPAAADYRFNLGYAYVLERNYHGGLYWLREALRRNPADADAHFVLAAALQGTSSSVEAARERELARQLSSRYEELERRASTDRLSVPKGLERVRTEPGGLPGLRVDQAIVSSAQRDQRDLATFHLERGKRLFERGQDSDAMAELKRAVYLSPYQADAHLLMGRIHLRGGRPGDAITALKISIWSADTAPAHAALAEAYLKNGDSKAARTEAERALALDPGSGEARRILGNIK